MHLFARERLTRIVLPGAFGRDQSERRRWSHCALLITSVLLLCSGCDQEQPQSLSAIRDQLQANAQRQTQEIASLREELERLRSMPAPAPSHLSEAELNRISDSVAAKLKAELDPIMRQQIRAALDEHQTAAGPKEPSNNPKSPEPQDPAPVVTPNQGLPPPVINEVRKR